MTTTIPASRRFFPVGVNKVLFLETVAAPTTGATAQEISAGVELQDEISGASGWDSDTNMIATPDAGSRVVGQIPGRVTLGTSTFTFYGSQDGEDIRTIHTKGDHGYVLMAHGGLVKDYPYSLYEVEIANISAPLSIDEKAFEITVSYALLREPLTDVKVPELS